MCELIVMAASREGGTHRSYRRGDVIAVGPDGMDWGSEGSRHPEWRTLRLLRVTELEAQALLSDEVETDPQNPNYRLQRRGFRLDLDAMPAELQAWIADDARSDPVLELDWAWADLAPFRYRVEPLPDPNTLGA